MRYPNRVSFASGGTTLILLALSGQGCGTDLNNVLFQSFAAAGRSALDIALTNAANGIADAADGLAASVNNNPNQGEDGGEPSGGTDNDGGGGTTDDGTPTAVDGDGANGQVVFEANGCSTCHCDDASGGCALSAPSIQAADVSLVGDKLTGAVGHAGGTRELGEAELADLAAYLADLAGGGNAPDAAPDQGAAGDSVAGQGLFEANGCSTCHCDDASGGCALSAPSIQAADVSLVGDKLTGAVGHAGGTTELGEAELADLAAYLADLAGVGVTPDQNVDANVASGRVLYEANGCGSCHCADGSGGCALSAPAITGTSTSMLDEFLRGATPHAGGKKVLSDGGLASIAAFLAGG